MMHPIIKTPKAV